MALEDYRIDMETCCRCSICKFVPLEKLKEKRHSYVCPSISRYNYHTYSGGGRMGMGIAMLEEELEYDEKLLEVIYNCQVCGACDISCKYAMDMEVLEPIYEFRIKAVETGHTQPTLDKTINSLRKQGTMVSGARGKRGDWAASLNLNDAIRDKVDILYHVGCLASYDKNAQKLAKAIVKILKPFIKHQINISKITEILSLAYAMQINRALISKDIKPKSLVDAVFKYSQLFGYNEHYQVIEQKLKQKGVEPEDIDQNTKGYWDMSSLVVNIIKR